MPIRFPVSEQQGSFSVMRKKNGFLLQALAYVNLSIQPHHPCMLVFRNAHMHTYSCAGMRAYMYPVSMFIRLYFNIHMSIRTCKASCVRVGIRGYVQVCTCTNTQKQADTHTHMKRSTKRTRGSEREGERERERGSERKREREREREREKERDRERERG